MESEPIRTKNPLGDRDLYIVTGINLITIMGALTIAPILPDLANVFQVSSNEIQWVMIAFFLPIGIVTPILGVVTDRLGIKPILVPSLLLFAVAGGCAAFARDFQILVGWRFLQGLGVTSLNFITLTLISMMYRGEALTTAMSFNVGIIGISTAICPIIGALLAGLSWHYPFLLSVIALPLLMLVVMVLKLPRSPKRKAKSDLKTYLQETWRALSNPAVRAILLTLGAVFAFQSGAFTTYIPILAGANFGASGLVNGLILSSMSVSMAMVAPQLGRLTRLTSEIDLIKISFVITAIALGIIPMIHSAAMLVLPGILFGIAQALALAPSQILLARLAVDGTRAGFMAVNASAQSLGQALGPLVAGISFNLWGLQGVFWATAAIALLVLALFNFLVGDNHEKFI